VIAVATPERTCVGCRRKRGQDELVRLVASHGQVVKAWPGAPGRSAYVCPQENCLEAAEKKRAFARAFRGPVTLDPAVRAVFEGPGKMRFNHDSPHDYEPAATKVRRSGAAPHHSVPAATIDERR
jgi:predicted RNA-binding protein YlxR (DUF448 family)